MLKPIARAKCNNEKSTDHYYIQVAHPRPLNLPTVKPLQLVHCHSIIIISFCHMTNRTFPLQKWICFGNSDDLPVCQKYGP